MATEDQLSSLSDNLQRLEDQIARLADLLGDQAARKKRRRTLSIRMLLVSFVGFALLFAWAGSLYQRSRRQARAVDQLIQQGAFVLYSPNQSALVSMLPGEVEQPPKALQAWLGDDFFRSVTNVSTAQNTALTRDKAKIIAALQDFPDLKLLRLTNLDLRSGDLAGLGTLRQLQSLDLTATRLDGGGMPWLGRTELRWLKAAHTRFGDRALADLVACRQLQFLDLERTTVSDRGIAQLASLRELRYLNLKRCPVTLRAVQNLSAALPGCVIDWEPLQFRADGTVDAVAARQGRVRLGRSLPKDPRVSRRALAPIDSTPSPDYEIIPVWNSGGRRMNYRNGFLLDVF